MTRGPFVLKGIDHIVLRVADLQKSLDFYCSQLGCVQERSIPELGLYQLRAGEQLIDLIPIGAKLAGTEPRAASGLNVDHFCLFISPFDPEQLLSWAQKAGLQHSEVATRYGARGDGPSLYLHDPDGNTVELKGESQA